jgi:hypothetical protein
MEWIGIGSIFRLPFATIPLFFNLFRVLLGHFTVIWLTKVG